MEDIKFAKFNAYYTKTCYTKQIRSENTAIHVESKLICIVIYIQAMSLQLIICIVIDNLQANSEFNSVIVM